MTALFNEEDNLKKNIFKIFLISLLVGSLFSCNSDPNEVFDVETKLHYQLVSELKKDTNKCDLERIKSIKIYDYCCDSGWANLPVTFTLYSAGEKYRPHSKYTDLLFENVPFESYKTDKWGNAIVWSSEDTGNYRGSPKVFSLSKTLNLTKIDRLVLTYTLKVSKKFTNGGGIQIAFVDKDGNESENIYLNGK